MTNFWKVRRLLPPPICSMKVEINEDNFDDLNKACETFLKCDSIRSDQSALVSELCLLTRLIYKSGSQYRSDKIMRGLKRVESCLERYTEIDLFSDVSDYAGSMMRSDLLDCHESYLPSRQMLEYRLLQWMRADVLLLQTANYSAYTFAIIYRSLEAKGHLIPKNTIFLALVSRVWVLCKSLSVNLEEWYGSIHPCLLLLKSTQVPWLPENQILPIEMSDWVKQQVKVAHYVDGEKKLESYIEEEKGENIEFAEDNIEIHNHSIMKSGGEFPEEDLGAPVIRETDNLSRETSVTSSIQSDSRHFMLTSLRSITEFKKAVRASQSIDELLSHVEKLEPFKGLHSAGISKMKKKLSIWNKKAKTLSDLDNLITMKKYLKRGCILVLKVINSTISQVFPEKNPKKKKMKKKIKTSGSDVQSQDDLFELFDQSEAGKKPKISKSTSIGKRKRSLKKTKVSIDPADVTTDDPDLKVSNRKMPRSLETQVYHPTNDNMATNDGKELSDVLYTDTCSKRKKRKVKADDNKGELHVAVDQSVVDSHQSVLKKSKQKKNKNNKRKAKNNKRKAKNNKSLFEGQTKLKDSKSKDVLQKKKPAVGLNTSRKKNKKKLKQMKQNEMKNYSSKGKVKKTRKNTESIVQSKKTSKKKCKKYMSKG